MMFYSLQLILDTRISFRSSLRPADESKGVVVMRLIADNVFEKEQFVDLSAQNNTAHGG